MVSNTNFTVEQACHMVTGDNGELDYIFSGSDDKLDAFELSEEEDMNGNEYIAIK